MREYLYKLSGKFVVRGQRFKNVGGGLGLMLNFGPGDQTAGPDRQPV